jgi:crotonobetainyl-CoA:carnitine CoA-transferase CaiB-like acyl-CoA transferase
VLIYIDKHWKSFCELIGREDVLQDPRFLRMSDRTRNVDALYAFVAEQIATRSTAQWMEALTKADIPVAPMHTPDSLMQDPHLADGVLFEWVEHPSEGRIRQMNVPGTWSDTPPSVRRHAPLLGENTRELLAEVGYPADEIERLLAKGAAHEAGTP